MRAYALRVYTSTSVGYEALPIPEVSLVHDDPFNTGLHWWRMAEPHTSAATTATTEQARESTQEDLHHVAGVWGPFYAVVTLAGARLAAAAAEGLHDEYALKPKASVCAHYSLRVYMMRPRPCACWWRHESVGLQWCPVSYLAPSYKRGRRPCRESTNLRRRTYGVFHPTWWVSEPPMPSRHELWTLGCGRAWGSAYTLNQAV
jgi:hypothetical protein